MWLPRCGMQRRGDHKGRPFGANLTLCCAAGTPSPLWGRVVPRGTALLPSSTPSPHPSPQGGGEEFAAPLQRKLAQMRVAHAAGDVGGCCLWGPSVIIWSMPQSIRLAEAID